MKRTAFWMSAIHHFFGFSIESTIIVRHSGLVTQIDWEIVLINAPWIFCSTRQRILQSSNPIKQQQIVQYKNISAQVFAIHINNFFRIDRRLFRKHTNVLKNISKRDISPTTLCAHFPLKFYLNISTSVRYQLAWRGIVKVKSVLDVSNPAVRKNLWFI